MVVKGLFSGAADAAGSAVSGASQAVGGISGAAGSAGSVAGSVGGVASSIGGAVSGILGAVSSVVGIIGGIGSVLGAASQIFGFGSQSTDLGRIEENTRYTQIALIGQNGVIDILWGLNSYYWVNQLPMLYQIHDVLQSIYGFLTEWIYNQGITIKNHALNDILNKQASNIIINLRGVIDQ